MAVFARELTRESLWEAFKKRRVYGVTGDRIKLYFSINGHIMGEVFNSRKAADIHVEVTGSHAIDRIEIIRNGEILYTYSHSGKWHLPRENQAVRAKLRIQFGWGPASLYGFKKIEPKRWKGTFKISPGRIVSIEPCFTYFGQSVKQISEETASFTFTCQPRASMEPLLAQHHRSNFQGAIFEVEASLESLINIEVDSMNLRFSLEDTMERERIIAFTEESKKMIYEEFGLRPEDIENPDVYWHNAWKMKIYRTIPYDGYHVEFRYVDENPRTGENYYYVRIRQLNGQMAWSSPIWMRYQK